MTPGQLDRDVVRRHLTTLDAAIAHLRRHAGRRVEALDSDLDQRWIVERGLQVCAQNALDVATHIAASAGRDVPDYSSAIDRLGELGVLDPEFARRFWAVAGFRNLLVHGYLEVDARRLHAVLNERLEDFVGFAERVGRYLGASGRDRR